MNNKCLKLVASIISGALYYYINFIATNPDVINVTFEEIEKTTEDIICLIN
jgi:hypothetical protein